MQCRIISCVSAYNSLGLYLAICIKGGGLKGNLEGEGEGDSGAWGAEKGQEEGQSSGE